MRESNETEGTTTTHSQRQVGEGGFFLPAVYEENRAAVTDYLEQGDVLMVEGSKLSLADQFLAFVLQMDFLKFVDGSYPTPREKTEVPIWFLVSCQFVLKLSHEVAYNALGVLLENGPVLSRVGFNIGAAVAPGFNDKNKKPRRTPVHQDSVRKFFKDTDPLAMRRWYNTELQGWFRRKRAFCKEGVFVLDQTLVVVPDNPNYEDAVRLPVDAHGKRYKNLDEITPEQKRVLKYHPCLALSTLLHLPRGEESFHIAGYELGPGSEDEIVQARKILDAFFSQHSRGTMQLLIMDRGYISGQFISWLKKDHGVDVLIPLRSNMELHQEAVTLATKTGGVSWEMFANTELADGRLVRACPVKTTVLWEECTVPLYLTVAEVENSDGSYRYFTLCSTKEFSSAREVITSYRLRTRVEECYRQFKTDWRICAFPSPARSLREAHIGFTFLTYSLLQMYLSRLDLQKRTNKFLSIIRREELGAKAILVYADRFFTTYSVKDYSLIINRLTEEARIRFEDALTSDPQPS